MFSRYLILACIISRVLSESVNSEEHPDSPFTELPCMVINGTCRAPGKCPQGTRVTTEGLCPYQENRGIQCCHSSKAKLAPQRTCRLKGGECMEPGIRCPKMYTIKASDCEPDSSCCILVH